jgi:hypothetical protein
MVLASCAALSAGLVATDAIASAPTLSGSYAVSGTVFCQPGTTGAASGAYDVNVGVITFYPSDGTIAMTQTQVLGSVTDTSLPFSLIQKTYNYTYSNTARDITLNTTSYKAVYSNIQNGIVQAMSAVGVDTNGCARNFTLQFTTVPVPPPPPRPSR